MHRHHQREELPRSRPRVPLERQHPMFLRDPVVWDLPPPTGRKRLHQTNFGKVSEV